LIARLAVLVVLSGLQCVLAWLVAASLAGLKAPTAQAIGLLALASAVGLALGLLILTLAPGRAAAMGVAAVAVFLLWVFGTPAAQLWKSPGARIVANVLPARWAFEGLLVLESDHHDRLPLAAAASNPGRDGESDLAEAYFPGDSERMGARADAMALMFMFIGLAAGATFISSASRLGP
jgi:hypothetical protein